MGLNHKDMLRRFRKMLMDVEGTDFYSHWDGYFSGDELEELEKIFYEV